MLQPRDPIPAAAEEPLPRPRAVPFPVPEKYQPLRVIGSGGLGTVVLARDRSLGRLLALKFLHESCSVFLERFRNEARLMARLVHPAIVRVYEQDVFEGRTYLAMEYVDGGNLALARLAPEDLVRTVRPVVDALALAHRNGFVHRDVKPENVLLDRGGRAYLSDFGLALGPGEGAARTTRPVAGTPLTMSPEQARGEVVGPASDVFSLGVTLYRALTGAWPFRGRTVVDVLEAIQEAAPTPPRETVPAVPRPLEVLVLRCLEKEPERRFPSMDALGEALDGCLAPRGLLGRMTRLLRRGASRRSSRIHPESAP